MNFKYLMCLKSSQLLRRRMSAWSRDWPLPETCWEDRNALPTVKRITTDDSKWFWPVSECLTLTCGSPKIHFFFLLRGVVFWFFLKIEHISPLLWSIERESFFCCCFFVLTAFVRARSLEFTWQFANNGLQSTTLNTVVCIRWHLFDCTGRWLVRHAVTPTPPPPLLSLGEG